MQFSLVLEGKFDSQSIAFRMVFKFFIDCFSTSCMLLLGGQNDYTLFTFNIKQTQMDIRFQTYGKMFHPTDLQPDIVFSLVWCFLYLFSSTSLPISALDW